LLVHEITKTAIMCKRNILLSTAAMFFLLITSCETNEPPPNCGTVKFSWKADGTYYEGASNYHFLPSGGGHHSFGFSACTTGNSPSLSLRLKGPIQAGTYNLMDINDAD